MNTYFIIYVIININNVQSEGGGGLDPANEKSI